jgi:MYND finger
MNTEMKNAPATTTTTKQDTKSWEDYKKLLTQLVRRVKDLMRTCSACHKPGARFKCGDCLLIYYCNEKCQRDHWDTGGHSEKCPSYQKEISATPEPRARRRTLVYQTPIRSTDAATSEGFVEVTRIHRFCAFIGCFISPFIIFVQTKDNRYVCIPCTRKRTNKKESENVWQDTDILSFMRDAVDSIYRIWLSMFVRLRPPIANEITKERLISSPSILHHFHHSAWSSSLISMESLIACREQKKQQQQQKKNNKKKH